MLYCKSPIEGLVIVTLSSPVEDPRGSFMRLFCKKMLSPYLQGDNLEQISHSISKEQGTIRGMHYQNPPYEEIKMVRCIRGRVWDVAVDIRENSPTRYQWHGEELSSENNKMMILGKGFAHGFQTLEPNTELLYFISTAYTPDAEAGLHPLDPALGISWPLTITNLSERDKNHPYLAYEPV